jgi:hypothetical protein
VGGLTRAKPAMRAAASRPARLSDARVMTALVGSSRIRTTAAGPRRATEASGPPESSRGIAPEWRGEVHASFRSRLHRSITAL